MTTGMKAHRITEERPIVSKPTIFTQKKALTTQDLHMRWVQQGTTAGWSKAEPHLDINTAFIHTAFLPIGSIMPQQLEERVQGHAGAASPPPSPPREQHVTYSTLSP